MKENGKSQIQEIKLPPAWCSALCKNAMNEVCIEHCAIIRNCSGFEMKPGINLIDMPRFPIDQIGEMTKEEKFMAVTVYLAKVVDHLNGSEAENNNFICKNSFMTSKEIKTVSEISSLMLRSQGDVEDKADK